MRFSRRDFIATASAAAAAMSLGSAAAAGQAGSMSDSLSKLRWASFMPFVGTDFTFGGAGMPNVVLTLIGIEDTRPPGLLHRRSGECFMLTFRGPASTPLEQATYEVDHFHIGGFSLFISAGPVTGDQASYYAVINRYMPNAATATA